MTEPDRLARLEAELVCLQKEGETKDKAIDRLRERIEVIIERHGKPNWNAVSVGLGMCGGLVAFFFFGPLASLHESVKSAAEDRAAIRSELVQLDERLRATITDEQKRNNDIGERLAKEEAVTFLYVGGMLRNPEDESP